jgi:hypothetical protein
MLSRILRLLAALVISIVALATPAAAQDDQSARETLHTWYRLILELVRHTPTYSPPVASRSFAYFGVTAFESVASGSDDLQSLAGQLNGLGAGPSREPGKLYSEAVVIQSAMAAAANNFFSNTGPTGQRALKAMEAKLGEKAAAGLPLDVAARSDAYGKALAAHILAWSATDGGAIVENMGFPYSYDLQPGDAKWVPTSLVRQQQLPLLPNWGANRPFAMPSGSTCGLPPPPQYSEDPASEFYKQALEVYETRRNLTPEQKAIARFWSDDPMLSPTPPGHWIAIAWQILQRDETGLEASADILARLGIALADSFIGCWHTKFEYNLLRPVTYIRRLIEPKWEPLMITPPFPEYPSGHSTQSGAAAEVLTAMLGENFAFEDKTHEADGLPARAYPNFWAAAQEAGMSRLYGGIHFRSAIEQGLEQGRCIAAYAAALKTRK